MEGTEGVALKSNYIINSLIIMKASKPAGRLLLHRLRFLTKCGNKTRQLDGGGLPWPHPLDRYGTTGDRLHENVEPIELNWV